MKTYNPGAKFRVFALLQRARLCRWTLRGFEGRPGHAAKSVVDVRPGPVALAKPTCPATSFGAEEARILLKLARASLRDAVIHGQRLALTDVPPKLAAHRACFVTLTLDQKLRGCVGHILPKESLAKAVVNNAHNAALCDPRFLPVTPDELERIRIEISVLSELCPLSFHGPAELLNQLHPHEDGVLLQIGSQLATFLPQVWNQFADKREFLNRLAEKAGCPRGAWAAADARVSTYRIESLEEAAVAESLS